MNLLSVLKRLLCVGGWLVGGGDVTGGCDAAHQRGDYTAPTPDDR